MKLPKLNPKQLNFVPEAQPVCPSDISLLERFVNRSRKLLVITGAGLSTESGIPDYRSEKVGLYARTDRRPMIYQEFINSEAARKKYWARSFVGWPTFSSYQPNICHYILSDWERLGPVSWLVTQNVDALHTKAGSRLVTELHGCLHRVLCLGCGSVTPRWHLQYQFAELNPNWTVESLSEQIAPDGDVMLSDQQVQDFKVPPCQKCGGTLKPDVVFFGDNVAKSTVDLVFRKVTECDSVLVAGSSLSVFSGYRFLRRAAELKKNIAILNIGETRADHLANIRINGRCGEILPKIQLSVRAG